MPVAHVLGDLVVDLDLGQMVPVQSISARRPFGDVGRLQQLTLLHVGQVRRVAGRVGQCDGSVSWLTKSMICQASRRCSIASSSFLYSAASARVSSVARRLDLGHLDPQCRAGSGGAGPMWRTRSPRTTAAVRPPAIAPTWTIDASTP
jgi:hypothetical protein